VAKFTHFVMTDTPDSQKDKRDAEVVSEHLPAGYTAGLDGTVEDEGNASASAPNLTQPEPESSLKLQGGDIHRELYKIDARARMQKRAATFAHTSPRRSLSTPDSEIPASDQRALGGFRRQFVQQKHRRFNSATLPVTRNFVEFLDLYGSFAGEDLAESEDESAIEDLEDRETEGADRASETRPLLGRRKSSKATKKGDAGITKTFFTLLKAFIGTGIMFLPKAFKNGGMLFSSITLVTVAMITTLAFHLLLQCRKQYGGGYGELGESIGGPKTRKLILASITISQLGFVCAGTVFVAENLFSFVDAVAKGSSPLSTNALIALQLVVLIPLAFIRNISKLGPAALVADVFILLGLTYIYYFDLAVITKNGIDSTVRLFNPNHYTLTIGAAIFTFEGIGLILPIQSSMKRPEKFERLLYVVMLIITIIFTSVGVLCYATFGSATQIEIISNYPQDSKLVNAVQFVYSLAVMVGTPVQLFPAVRILEGKLFGHLSGKRDSFTKWKKNGFRTGIVIICGLISILGAGNLDRFVALIGSFACVPLVYIYPPYLHYKGVAESRIAKFGDILFMALGFVGMVFTTCITVVNSFT
jgi:solute carrier family 36 (proton-coupled amino acid transporter)